MSVKVLFVVISIDQQGNSRILLICTQGIVPSHPFGSNFVMFYETTPITALKHTYQLCGMHIYVAIILRMRPPYHMGSGSHGQLFRPCQESSAWQSQYGLIYDCGVGTLASLHKQASFLFPGGLGRMFVFAQKRVKCGSFLTKKTNKHEKSAAISCRKKEI